MKRKEDGRYDTEGRKEKERRSKGGKRRRRRRRKKRQNEIRPKQNISKTST